MAQEQQDEDTRMSYQEENGTVVLRKSDRVQIANAILEAVSRHGRRFFRYEDRVGKFDLSPRGQIWFVDAYRNKRIYVSYRGRWRYFSEGGTLRALVENLRDFIAKNAPIRKHFGPWPEWVCDGDLWGYGKEAMTAVRQEIDRLNQGNPNYRPHQVQP